jgi:nucleotide-binding universal stress UspA family protein
MQQSQHPFASTRRIPPPRTDAGGPRRSFLVVVGVDGSDTSVHALAWALGQARQKGWAVEVVTAWPINAAVFVHGVPGHFCEPRWQAARIQATAAAAALVEVEGSPTYSARLENGLARDVLVRAAADANMLVLGTDQINDNATTSSGAPAGFSVLVPGVPGQLTSEIRRRADCPVVLVSRRSKVHASAGEREAECAVGDPQR